MLYEEMLTWLADAVRTLNDLTRRFDDGPLVPYLGKCEVVMEGEVVGFLIDEVGGSWSYHPR